MAYVLEDKNEIFNIYACSCSFCIHFDIESLTCGAFKEGIPDEILSGENKHLEPLKSQNNSIVFKAKN